MIPLHRLADVLPVLTLVACASMQGPACSRGQQSAVLDLLYFGTETPSRRVTPEDWAQFLDDTVTPRYPDGLTAWQASGQWRSNSGAIVQEPSYVLSLVHPQGTASEQAIKELIAAYKVRFQQEAMLRVNSYVCTSL